MKRPYPEEGRALTAREIEILQYVADGMSNNEAGVMLNVTGLTVKSHLARISHKLGIHRREALVAHVVRQGLVDPPDVRLKGPVTVTERWQQILQAAAGGLTNEEIARQLYLAEDTVKTHLQRGGRRLGLSSRAGQVAYALGQGWIT